MTDSTGTVYAENETELSWSIRPSVDCDENHIKQWCDKSYKCGLRWKQNWATMIDQIGCRMWRKPNRTTTWMIIYVQSRSKTKLSYPDRSNWVWYVMKIEQENFITNRTNSIYDENDTKPSWSIEPSVDYNENQKRQWHDWLYRYCQCQKQNWAIMTYRTGYGLWQKQDRRKRWSIV